MNKSIQYVVMKLKDRLEIGFMEDNETKEVIICPESDYCSKHITDFLKANQQCKILMILDCEERLKLIRGIQILESLPDGNSFIDYVKNKCTFALPVFHKKEDTIIEEMEEKTKVESFFTSLIYPMIQRGIIVRSLKKEIPKAISESIVNIIKKGPLPIERYKNAIRVKYYNNFIKWLQTEEAKKVCECLISSKLKYNFNPFEINYLLNNLSGDNK